MSATLNIVETTRSVDIASPMAMTTSPLSDGCRTSGTSGTSGVASVSSSNSNDYTPASTSPTTDTLACGGGKCVICEDVVHGMHFGALACRACAAFFRRSTISARKYVCRFGGKCSVNKEVRFCCRACRFEKCILNGMKADSVQRHRDNIGSRKEPSNTNCNAVATVCTHASSNEPSTSKSAILNNPNEVPFNYVIDQANTSLRLFHPIPGSAVNLSLPVGFPVVDSLTHLTKNQIYKTLDIPCTNPIPLLSEISRGYKKLCMIRKTANGLMDNAGLMQLFTNTPEMSEGTYNDRIAAIKTDLPLVSEMLNSHFLALAHFSVESKWHLLRNFFGSFLIADQGFTTARVFPDSNDPRILFSCRHYINIDNMEKYFNVEACKSDPVEVAKIFEKLFRRFRDLVYNAIRNLDLNDDEIAGVLGMLFWSQNLNPLNPTEAELAQQSLEAILDELYYVCRCRIKDLNELGTRFGRICGLLHVIRKSAQDIVETFSVVKILNIFDIDTFLCSFMPYAF